MVESGAEISQDYDYPTPGHMIIWLDAHIGKPGECQHLKKAFFSTLDPHTQTQTKLTDPDFDSILRANEMVKIDFAGVPFQLLAFDDPNKCYEAFESHKDKHIYFITSGTLGKDIISMLIENHKELFTDPITKKPYSSIYIFCGYTKHHYEWMYDAREYIQIFNHEADLLTRMTRDVAEYFVEQSQRYLQNALRRLKWSKKLYTRYSEMGESSVKEMKQVEQLTAGIERILHPQISNPHVDENNLNQNNYNGDNFNVNRNADEDDERLGETVG